MAVSGQIPIMAALFPVKGTLYALDMRLGGPQSRSGSYEKEKRLVVAKYMFLKTCETSVLGFITRSIETLELQNTGEGKNKISHVHHAMKTYRTVEV
jgi:hypothetical protein